VYIYIYINITIYWMLHKQRKKRDNERTKQEKKEGDRMMEI